MRVVVIDHQDSFVHNLARYLRLAGAATEIVPAHGGPSVEAVLKLRPDALVLSPGPAGPAETGLTLDLIRLYGDRLPMLGVCLGHQAIGHVLGARIARAQVPMHGRASSIRHGGQGLFAGLPTPFEAGRYHALIVRDLPPDLVATAWSPEGEVMALQHRAWPLHGVQFHPESVLTPLGMALIERFLAVARGD